ncbi:MAG: hypothetical protein V1815_00060, partial [Candidatus Woesearchaeota archaeon]
MVNKKGYLKTIEAVIAILIILGFIYVITPKNHLPEETTPQNVESSEEFIVTQVLYNSTYRDCIVKDDRPCVETLVKKNTPSGYNYQFEMCDTSTSCLQKLGITLPIDKSIYSKNVFISQESGLINPKVFRIYMWEGKVASDISCTDDCTTNGLKQCYTNTSYQICGQYDTDACLDWNIVNCNQGQICSNGNCISSCTLKTCSDLGKTCGSWSDGCNGTINCGNCPSNSLIRQVSARSDDCGIDIRTATFYLNTAYYATGIYSTISQLYHQSFRFTNISIPQGAVIKNAHIIFVSYSVSPGTGTAVYTKISAENQDNAIAPTTYADFIGRTLTNTKVDWDITSNW